MSFKERSQFRAFHLDYLTTAVGYCLRTQNAALLQEALQTRRVSATPALMDDGQRSATQRQGGGRPVCGGHSAAAQRFFPAVRSRSVTYAGANLNEFRPFWRLTRISIAKAKLITTVRGIRTDASVREEGSGA